MSSLLDNCGYCGATENLQRCARCQHIVYCSKEHQIAHWTVHKKQCSSPATSHEPVAHHNANTNFKPSVVNPIAYTGIRNNIYPSVAVASTEQRANNIASISPAVKSQGNYSSPEMPVSSSSASSAYVNGGGLGDNLSRGGGNGVNGNGKSLTSSKRGSKKNKAVKVNSNSTTSLQIEIEKRDEDNLENHAPSSLSPSPPADMSTLSLNATPPSSSVPSTDSGLRTVIHPNPNSKITPVTMSSVSNNTFASIRPSPSTCNYSKAFPFLHRNADPSSAQHEHRSKWVLKICQQVISDMDKFGVCVVDNLLGEEQGDLVSKEVQSMYTSGKFKDGQLVKEQKDGSSASHNIRGDKITWVDGKEPHCRSIDFLISLVDSIIIGANKLTNNGKLGAYTIQERTKAMVACYPGYGTHYVKHVDNPNQDGRCVTAIYYLNKDWNTKEHGGLLRIFPEGWPNQVADIEPLFDRVLFFWSDRRNPHEVQPAFKTRYAITLWYFDATEVAVARDRDRSQFKVPFKS